MTIKSRSLGNFGVELLDLKISEFDNNDLNEVLAFWQQNPLILIRGQCMSEVELRAFSAHFGKLEVVVRKDIHSKENPEIAYLSNLMTEDGKTIGGLSNDELSWHSDQAYRLEPATGAIFLAVEIPEQGGNTWWANTELAYDALSPELKEELDDKIGEFKYLMYQSDITDEEQTQEIQDLTPDAAHPMVLTNPSSGIKSLYVDYTQTIAIQGMEKSRSDAILKEIKALLIRDDFIYQHKWKMGDVMMWDNARLLHRRDPYDKRLPRLAKRSTIFLNPEQFAVPF